MMLGARSERWMGNEGKLNCKQMDILGKKSNDKSVGQFHSTVGASEPRSHKSKNLLF